MTLYDNTDLEDAHCMCSKKVKVSYSAKSFDIYDKEEDARQNKNKFCSPHVQPFFFKDSPLEFAIQQEKE